jgi:hypothetical protein
MRHLLHVWIPHEAFSRTKAKLSLRHGRRQLEPWPAQDGKTLAEQDALLGQHFAAADADRDGRVTFDEFAAYLPAVSGNKARSQLRAALGVEVESERRTSTLRV